MHSFFRILYYTKYSILHIIKPIIAFSFHLESPNILFGKLPRHSLEKNDAE